MRCPGCGAELAEGSEYCSHCRGRIKGSTIDYAQARVRADEVYEDRSYEPVAPEPLSVGEETMIDVMSVRLAVLMFALPVLGLISVFAGLDQHRSDFLVYGAVFFVMFALLVVLYFKYYREEEPLGKPQEDRPPPRFLRRV